MMLVLETLSTAYVHGKLKLFLEQKVLNVLVICIYNNWYKKVITKDYWDN